jgi:hypothetical protein
VPILITVTGSEAVKTACMAIWATSTPIVAIVIFSAPIETVIEVF